MTLFIGIYSPAERISLFEKIFIEEIIFPWALLFGLYMHKETCIVNRYNEVFHTDRNCAEKPGKSQSYVLKYSLC